jgi:hypothetical protein
VGIMVEPRKAKDCRESVSGALIVPESWDNARRNQGNRRRRTLFGVLLKFN